MNQIKKKSMTQEQILEMIKASIFSAKTVGEKLGPGFLEKVYENALVYELRSKGLEIMQQIELQVMYDGQAVGSIIADIVVESNLIIELKAVKKLDEEHRQQLKNYMKVTGIEGGLLINYGNEKPEIEPIES